VAELKEDRSRDCAIPKCPNNRRVGSTTCWIHPDRPPICPDDPPCEEESVLGCCNLCNEYWVLVESGEDAVRQMVKDACPDCLGGKHPDWRKGMCQACYDKWKQSWGSGEGKG
jgi:hypothetical protein